VVALRNHRVTNYKSITSVAMPVEKQEDDCCMLGTGEVRISGNVFPGCL